MEKKQESMESTCSSSSNMKDGLPKAKEKSKKRKKRMGGLLDGIRGKKYDNHKKKRSEDKIKRLQIRWNRFDDEEERYKTVKAKDGGGYRYIEVNPRVHVSFREITKRALNLYFDQDGCNVFQENEFDCISSLCNKAGIHIDENNDLWGYLECKGLFISKTVFVLKTQFITDTKGDDLPELRLTSIPNTSHQLPELRNIFEESNNAISISPVNDHSPESAIINLMDNIHHQHESVYLEQQPQLPSSSTEANNMTTIFTTEIQNNSARPFFANLIDSASAGNLYFDGQENEQLLNMAEPEGSMNSSQETIPHTGNTTYLLTAKINRMKLKTDLDRSLMKNKVGIYFFVLKVLHLFTDLSCC